MKVIYNSSVLDVLSIKYVSLPSLIIGKRKYKESFYIAVKTNIGTFEVNGKSKIFNTHVFNTYNLDFLCMYSKKLKVVYETILEKSEFYPIINYKK